MQSEEVAALTERVNEAEAQCRQFGEMFTRQSRLIDDLYALLVKVEALGKQAMWDGTKVEPAAIRALLADLPARQERWHERIVAALEATAEQAAKDRDAAEVRAEVAEREVARLTEERESNTSDWRSLLIEASAVLRRWNDGLDDAPERVLALHVERLARAALAGTGAGGDVGSG